MADSTFGGFGQSAFHRNDKGARPRPSGGAPYLKQEEDPMASYNKISPEIAEKLTEAVETEDQNYQVIINFDQSFV